MSGRGSGRAISTTAAAPVRPTPTVASSPTPTPTYPDTGGLYPGVQEMGRRDASHVSVIRVARGGVNCCLTKKAVLVCSKISLASRGDCTRDAASTDSWRRAARGRGRGRGGPRRPRARAESRRRTPAAAAPRPGLSRGAGVSRDTFSCKRATPYHIYETVKSILRTRTDGDAAPRYPARDREPRADTPLRGVSPCLSV